MVGREPAPPDQRLVLPQGNPETQGKMAMVARAERARGPEPAHELRKGRRGARRRRRAHGREGGERPEGLGPR